MSAVHRVSQPYLPAPAITISPDVTKRQQQATSPTTGQTRPRSAGEKVQNHQSDNVPKLSDKGRTHPSPTLSPLPRELYPLTHFLNSLLAQEKTLWEKNEIVLKSLKCEPANSEVPDLDSPTDGISVTTASTKQTGNDDAEQNREGLYFIRYGQLTDTIHKYFWKLEKHHSCLHLTGRKAKHEALRHVERTIGGRQPECPPTTTTPTPQRTAGDSQVVLLRDEELLVYRCALMCSQFPMLSAPRPPDGQSPTPPPPPLPSVFSTSTLEYSQTAPGPEGIRHQANGEISPNRHGHFSNSVSSEHYLYDRKVFGPSSTSIGRENQQFNHDPSHLSKEASEACGTRVLSTAGASEPISIKGGRTRVKSRYKRHSVVSEDGDMASLAKLPPGDSDEEAELVKLISAKPSSGSESTPTGREHPFSPMVSREMLYSLVRLSFQQTEEQQVNFETTLKHEYGRRSKGEILARELAGRLQVLDNNAHPFYKPRLFVTRNGYDLWLQGEKERVRKLIDKFWHYSLPRPQLWRNFNPIDYHRAYTVLLRKIIDCESRTDRKEPVHSGKTPSSPLSPTAQRLLTEFGLRYGVGELYQHIVYLEYLSKHFDYEIWYIKHCTEELRSIRSLLPRNRNRITAVRPEMEILRATIHLLHGQADNSLTRIDRLFHDSDPRKGVASLIELLGEVLDAEQNLFGKRVRSMENWLKKYLKEGFVLRYERRKEIASDETVDTVGTGRTAKPFVLTPTLVNSLLLDTRDEVYEFRDKFQSVFRPYFDIVPFSKVEFYRLLCADACSLCARTLHQESTSQSLSLEMLGLMYRLNERDIEWQSVIEPEHQLWRHEFQNLACKWMEVLSKEVDRWTVQSVESDQWTLLAFNVSNSSTPSPPLSSSTSPSLPMKGHSSSWRRRDNNPHILSSIRNSPFPSPPAPNLEGPFNSRAVIGGQPGAFTPYRQVITQNFKCSPVLSESSGAITDFNSANCWSPPVDTSSSPSIAGETSYLSQGPGKKRNSPESDTITFAQQQKKKVGLDSDEPGRRTGIRPSFQTSEEDNVVQSSHVIEVSVSVYSGSDDQYDRHESLLPPVSANNQGLPLPASTFPSELHTTERKMVPEVVEGHPPSLSEQNEVPEVEVHPSAEALPSHTTEQDMVPDKASSLSKGNEELESNTTSRHETGDPIAMENGSTGQLVEATASVGVVPVSLPPPNTGHGGYVQATPPNPVLADHSPSSLQCTAFNNLLDKCQASDSDIVHSKARVDHAFLPRQHYSSDQNDKDHRRLPGWDDKHNSQPTSHSSFTETSSYHPQSDTTLHGYSNSTLSKDLYQTMSSSRMPTTSPVERFRDDPRSSFLFPVSNSPMDVVTMLSRLASFTGKLLKVLTPKIRKTALPRNNKLLTNDEYAPEVTKARNQASERQRNAKNMKSIFLRKLNKITINSLKLYADNLLCMDLCGWSLSEAKALLGDQMLSHLKRRQELEMIWGCRHQVEARHGMHPNGLPCYKNSNEMFEHVTRDMCIRINNIHVLITIFHSLEDHLYSMIQTDVQRPISAFGYVSSDLCEMTPNMRLLHSKTNKPRPARSHKTGPSSPQVDRRDTASWPSSVSTGLGPMEPDSPMEPSQSQRKQNSNNSNKKGSEDLDLPPKQSQECLNYLKEVQRFQVKMIALRMNKFCKRALSELLGLKLANYPIEKRLVPVVDYLDRHRVALQKYIYPSCFNTIMVCLWECLLQNLEEEAVKLKSNKRPVTDKAKMLLQALAYLIQFMHNRGDGLEIDMLNSSSEYLQGLLDIMTRSTDQLISIFNRLSTPRFSCSVLDLNEAPVVVDSHVLRQLHKQLHSDRKCFTGKEFTDKVMEIGQSALAESFDDVEAINSIKRSHIMSPTGQPIEYNDEYSNKVAQYLLDEGILILVPRATSLSDGSSILLTPESNTDEEDCVMASSYNKKGLTDSTRPVGMNSAISFVSETNEFQSSVESPGSNLRSAANSRNSGRAPSSASRNNYPRHGGHSDGQQGCHYIRGRNSQPDKPNFSATSYTYYKFAGSEDAFFQSQILMASTISPNSLSLTSSRSPNTSSPMSRRSVSGRREETEEFVLARRGTLSLVYDLLCQRARKEKAAKQFLNNSQRHRQQAGNTSCNLIFKM